MARTVFFPDSTARRRTRRGNGNRKWKVIRENQNKTQIALAFRIQHHHTQLVMTKHGRRFAIGVCHGVVFERSVKECSPTLSKGVGRMPRPLICCSVLTATACATLFAVGCSVDLTGEQADARNVAAPIEDDYSDIPIRKVDDIEFTTVTDRIWRIPEEGKETPIKLELHIRNCGERQVCFYLFDTCPIPRLTRDGKAVPIGFGRISSRRAQTLTPWIVSGSSFTVDQYKARLYRRPGGALSLCGEDGYGGGGGWGAHDLQPGRYAVEFWYANKEVKRYPDGREIWQGRVRTDPVEIEIK